MYNQEYIILCTLGIMYTPLTCLCVPLLSADSMKCQFVVWFPQTLITKIVNFINFLLIPNLTVKFLIFLYILYFSYFLVTCLIGFCVVSFTSNRCVRACVWCVHACAQSKDFPIQ